MGSEALREATLLVFAVGHPCGGLPPLAVLGKTRRPETASLCPRAGSPLLGATLLGSVLLSCYVDHTSVRVGTSGLGGHWRRGRSYLEGTDAVVAPSKASRLA